MGNFRSDSRDRRSSSERPRGRFNDRSEGRSGGFSRGRGGFGGRDRDSRRPVQMHDVTCDKCGKECQVPFRPTGDKPVLCSDCFRKNDSYSDNKGSSSSTMTSDQFSKLNAKLDKIISILQELELDVEEEDEDEDIDEEDLEDEDDSEEDEETAEKK